MPDDDETTSAPGPASPAANPWLPEEILNVGAPGTDAAAGEAQSPPPSSPEPSDAPEHSDAAEHAPAAPRPRLARRALRRLPRRRPRKPRPTAHRDGRRRGLLLLLGLAVAVIAVLIVTRPEPGGQEGAIRTQAVDVPFTERGAVFDITRTATALWARQMRRSPPRAGRTWITIAARSRNVSREDFHPRSLGYRVRTGTGIIVGPEFARIPPELDARGRLPIGERSSVHLGFQVPTGRRDLTLEFDPGPDSPRIRVPLN